MIRIGALSNIPGERGENLQDAVTSELNEIVSTLEAIHGTEYTEFIVPVATMIVNTKQMVSLIAGLVSTDADRLFLNMMVMAITQQTMELVLARARAFVEQHPEHKLGTMPKFLEAFENDSESIIRKIEEYKEGKGK